MTALLCEGVHKVWVACQVANDLAGLPRRRSLEDGEVDGFFSEEICKRGFLMIRRDQHRVETIILFADQARV